MPRPVDNVTPPNRVACLICGAAFAIVAGANDAHEYREFLSDHRLCRLLGMPSAECVVNGCSSTGIGPAQRCPAHGGASPNFRDRLAGERAKLSTNKATNATR